MVEEAAIEHETARGMANALVSVVVPSYNHSEFVTKTLLSIFGQTHRPGELIVIDDGSLDHSPAVIERVLKDCPFRCELIARSRLGLTATLNEGLRRSRAEFFCYLASDDIWLPEFLAARVSMLKSRPEAVLAYGNAFSIDENDRIIDCTTDWAAYVDGDVRQMLLTTLAPISPTVVYRRSAIAEFGWNEEAKLEDYELYLRLSSRGDFAFDPRILSAWRQHRRNTSLNLAMMFEEKLLAQRRVASELGITEKELNESQALAKFRSAQEFMRAGQKFRALKLALENWRAISSFREGLRMSVGLVTPHALVQWNRARKRKQATGRYGELRL
jgi:alpha-1,3-rhamnosyltransferase